MISLLWVKKWWKENLAHRFCRLCFQVSHCVLPALPVAPTRLPLNLQAEIMPKWEPWGKYCFWETVSLTRFLKVWKIATDALQFAAMGNVI
jgi:hypothetical protein